MTPSRTFTLPWSNLTDSSLGIGVIVIPRNHPEHPWPAWLSQAFELAQTVSGTRLYDAAEALLLPCIPGRDQDEGALLRMRHAATALFDYGNPWMTFTDMDETGQRWHVLVLSDS